jgi:hypothetical protein
MFSQNDFKIPMHLSLSSNTNVNKLMLTKRYKSSCLFLKEEKEKNPNDTLFKAFVKTMILGYGSTHSAHGAGLFIDPYFRLHTDVTNISNTRGILTTRRSTVHKTAYQFLKTDNPNEAVIPIVDEDIVKKVLSPFSVRFDQHHIAGLTFKIIIIKKEDIEKVMERLSLVGQLVNKTTALWIAANNRDFEKTFKELMLEMSNMQSDEFDKYLEETINIPEKHGAKTIQLSILDDLNNVKEIYNESELFYLKLFRKIISAVVIEKTAKIPIQEEIQLSFSRLKTILKLALINLDHYESFILFIEYAFDEIIYIVSLSQEYSKDDVRQILTTWIKVELQLDGINQIMSPMATLGQSGMYLLTHLVYAAIDEILNVENFISGKLYLQRGTHFEIKDIVDYRLEPKDDLNKYEICYSFDNKQCLIEEYNKNQFLDIIISAFNENVSKKSNVYNSNDMVEMIETQLDIRKNLGLYQKRLIVIIDTTLNNFDDSKINDILMLYEEQIQCGQLAILTLQSLNKYFHMGLDKFPAGLSVGFYHQQYFEYIDAFYKKNTFNYDFYHNPIPKMIAHLVKHASPEIVEYQNKILKNSSFVHDLLIPHELRDTNQFISFHHPCTRDIYKDISKFIILQINMPNEERKKVLDKLIYVITHLMSFMGVKRRDGYGFNLTTYASIGPMFRLSIGTESQSDLKKIFSALTAFFSELNMMLELYKERMPDNHVLNLIDRFFYYFIAGKEPENIKKNKKISRASFFKNFTAAKKNNSQAQYHVGRFYEKGTKIQQDSKEAFAWYRIAAWKNNINALYQVAKCYEQGFGVKKNFKKSIFFYQKAAAQGHSQSQYRLGLHYKENKDIVMSGIYFIKSSLSHHKNAFFRLSQQSTRDGIESYYQNKTSSPALTGNISN